MSSWSRGDHHRYHDFEDLPRYVLPECLEAVGRGVGSLVAHLADYPESLADGYGRERALRSEAMQVVFPPADLTQLVALDRSSLDGTGRIAGRLVALDFGNGETEVALRRLGLLMDLEGSRKWIELAKGTGEIEDAWDELHVGLLPVLGTPALDRLEEAGITVLCRAGLAGAYWPAEAEAPSPETCIALAEEGRFLLVDAGSAWDSVRTREEDLKVLVRADRNTSVPAPPDSNLLERTRLILTVEGAGDSTRIRRAMALWDDKHLHIDIAAGLEADVKDEESLRFIRWLRTEGWPDAKIEAVLGGNLKDF